MLRVIQAATEASAEAKSIGEILENAGLNTLMGMGIVFLVLILISLIISAFGIIHKFEEKKEAKKRAALQEKDRNVPETALETAAYEVPMITEEVTDDRELAAVIAAAVAAFGGTDPSGFTVRSIRRIQNNGRRR